MRRLLRSIAFASALFTVGCSNGQATRASDAAAASSSSKTGLAAIPLAGRVTDTAQILTPKQRSTLTDKLEALERKTQHQFVVVTVPSLGGRDIAEYTKDLANTWGIGRAGVNDGVVLLVAPTERKVRIAVGYGVEKKLPDSLCLQIIEHKILPRFREGDMSGGIEVGTAAVISQLE
ncbi:MAG: TPM domain-containing protein [Novosphingobium sp.]